MNYSKVSNLILRYGLALTYLFSGYDLIAHPRTWSSFIPYWFANLLPVDVLTYIQFQGAIELLIALAFIFGILLRPAAFLSALEMVGILILYGIDAITFRDLAILGGSLAVFFWTFTQAAKKSAPLAPPSPARPSSTSTAASSAVTVDGVKKPTLSDSQRKLRIILVGTAFVLFSIIFIGLFWLSNTTKDQAGWLAFSYATGLSMIVLPCTLPLAFVIVPLAMGKEPKKGLAIAFAFALGITITLSMYGALIAKLGQIVGLDRAKDTMYLIAGIFAVVFGFGELGLIKLRVPTYSGAFPKFIQDRKDAAKGLLLGLLLGNVGLGCPNPAFYVLLSHIATVGSMTTGWFLTFVHAVGRVTPLLLLAILAVLGVDALSYLMKRREALTRATAWGVVGVGAFILTFGLLGHDWYVYSGLHALLERVTQEASFVTSYANQFGGIAHAHGVPSGPYLPYGSWLMVTLIAVPLIWNWRNKKTEVIKDNPESEKAYRWFGAYTIVTVLFLYTLFAITLPAWYKYQEAPAQVASHNAALGPMTAAQMGIDIRMTTITTPIRGGTRAVMSFDVIETATGKPKLDLELSHGEPMHLVGVRKGDLNQYFHIHPRLVNGHWTVEHTFTQPGIYNIWPQILYGGMHVNQKMAELNIGQATEISEPTSPDLTRVNKLNDDLVVTLKATPQLYAKTTHNMGFSVTDAGGFDLPVGTWLQANMHINIISPSGKSYSHLHTNYGTVGTDDALMQHTTMPGMNMQMPGMMMMAPAAKIVKLPFINVAQADGVHTAAPVTGDVENSIAFNPKDLRIAFAFPEAGRYKIFTEFVTASQPNIVRRGEFWVEVAGTTKTGILSGVPKIILGLGSLLLIAAIMPLIFKFLKEENIKVSHE